MSTAEDARLEAIMNVILAIAANDFDRRAPVGDGDDVLDGIAAGVNMLAEEVGRQRTTETRFRAGLLRSERLAAVGTLAAGVAHEINNPAAILLANFDALDAQITTLRSAIDGARGRLGAAEVARMEASLAETTEIVRVGLAEVERIATIVRALRNFASVDSEAIGTVRLHELAEQACALISREIAQRATLTRALAVTPAIAGDAAKLTQSIANLLLNAAQAIDEGAADRNEIAVSTSVEGDTIVLRVRDTGRGIPPELRERVFEPFFSTRPREKGSGLGLPLAADIAHQHRGELRLESEVGRGTTAELRIPIDTGLGTPAPPPPPIAERRPRVLFIDDEAQILRAYERLLASSYDVVTASSGDAAIALLERDRAWDAIVCDILMPSVDGAAVWEWVEATAPDLRDRFLFCSGGAFTDRGAALAAAQRERLLHKPLRRAQIVAAIAGVMARGAAQRATAP